jgi:HTH-type transcriptional regulator / antitoxin HipB
MIAKNPTDLGLLMREQRRKRGLDQQELARRARVSRQWVIEVERGKAGAEVGLVLRALGVLGLTLDIQEERPRVTDPRARPALDLDAVIERARAGGDQKTVVRPRANVVAKKKSAPKRRRK